MNHLSRKLCIFAAAGIAAAIILSPGCGPRPNGPDPMPKQTHCPLLLTVKQQWDGYLGGELAIKGVDVGRAKVTAGQKNSIEVSLSDLGRFYSQVAYDTCVDHEKKYITREEYMHTKACLFESIKQLTCLKMLLKSGLLQGEAAVKELIEMVKTSMECMPQPLSPTTNANLSENQPCSEDGQCEPPYYCIQGTCRTLGKPEDSCGSDMDCLYPLVCDAGVCKKTQPPSSIVGTACTHDENCVPPLFCILGTCRHLGNVGDSCGQAIDCISPLVCQNGTCASTVSPNLIDKSCGSDADCSPPLFCIKKTCRLLGKTGDACDFDYDCNIPLTCNDGVCGAAKDTGSACETDVQCTPPNYCILKKCQPLMKEGGDCEKNFDCLAGIRCQDGKCIKTNPNDPCIHDYDCPPPTYCIVDACRTLQDKGGVCRIDLDCLGGLKCQSGTCT